MEMPNCPVCAEQLSPSYFFCPMCGTQIREKVRPIGFMKQLGVYLLSIFLPPFGLIPALIYLTSYGTKAKVVGLLSLILSIMSIVFVSYQVTNIFYAIVPLLEASNSFAELSSYE